MGTPAYQKGKAPRGLREKRKRKTRKGIFRGTLKPRIERPHARHREKKGQQEFGWSEGTGGGIERIRTGKDPAEKTGGSPPPRKGLPLPQGGAWVKTGQGGGNGYTKGKNQKHTRKSEEDPSLGGHCPEKTSYLGGGQFRGPRT